MNLKGYTDKELQRELNNRKEAHIPKPLKGIINHRPLQKALRLYLETIVKDDGPIVRYEQAVEEHNIYRIALETFYGPTIWDWIKRFKDNS